MKRGGEDSTLFKRLLRRFPRIVASFVFPDGERDQAYSRDIRSNGRNVIPAAKGIRIERGSDDQQITIQLGYDGCDQ
jgi:hypothetical protein